MTIVQNITRTIPLNSLQLSEHNVRNDSGEDKAFVELKASIKHYGIQQNLVVVDHSDYFGVVAGGRRLRALQELANDGDIAHDYTIPCMVVADDIAKEHSLIENLIRKQMHPAQEYRVFAELFKSGDNLKDIANRFGCDVKLVKQRLALGQVHPDILLAYENDEIDAGDIKSIAKLGSADVQIKFFNEHNGSFGSWDIRSFFEDKGAVKVNDDKMTFIGLDNYISAGGNVAEDLFDGDNSYCENGALVSTLFIKKVNCIIDKYKFRFVSLKVAEERPNHSEYADVKCVEGKFELLPEEMGEYHRLSNILEDDRTYYEDRYLGFLKTLGVVYPDEQKFGAVFVFNNYNGFPLTVYSGIKNYNVASEDVNEDSAIDGNDDEVTNSTPKYSMALMEDFKNSKLQLLQHAVSNDKSLGFDLMVYQTVRSLMQECYYYTYVSISFNHSIANKDSDVRVVDNWESNLKSLNLGWYDKNSAVNSLEALINVSMQDKADIIGFMAGSYVNMKDDIKDYLAQRSGLNVRSHWTPEYENVFKRLKLPQLLEIAGEIIGSGWALNNADMKKKDVATILSNLCGGKNELGFGLDVLEKAKNFVPDLVRFYDVEVISEHEQVERDEPTTELPSFMAS